MGRITRLARPSVCPSVPSVFSLVVSTSATDCLERLDSEMAYYVSSVKRYVTLYSFSHVCVVCCASRLCSCTRLIFVA